MLKPDLRKALGDIASALLGSKVRRIEDKHINQMMSDNT
jgi:hypothetical protein